MSSRNTKSTFLTMMSVNGIHTIYHWESLIIGKLLAHKDVGSKKLRVVCMNRTFGEPCSICEERKTLIDRVGYEDMLCERRSSQLDTQFIT